MKFKVIFNTTGIILKYASFIFIFPILFAIFYSEYSSILPFLLTGILSYISGALFCLNDAEEKDLDTISRANAFVVVLSSWGVFGLICTVPFLFFGLSPINAFFESISGVSTTGATIISDFSLYPKTFFIYRSLLQWFGGMGIIVFFVAVLPKFAVAGRQMFFAESPNPTEEKITPRIRYTASWLWSIYILLTLVEIACLRMNGMNLYDSLCASFSTISAGGFSNYSESLIGMDDKIVWIIGLFTFLSGVNFLVTYKVLIKGKIKELFKNEEFKTYLCIVLLFSLCIALILTYEGNYGFMEAIKNAFFETTATITSCGFASADYTKFPFRAQVLLFVLMFIGASAISASGGIKITRWIYIFKYIKRELSKIAHPSAIIPIKIEQSTVNSDVGQQIIVFMMFFFGFFALSAIIVSFIEQDVIIAVTGSISTISNTGPAFSELLGPLGSFDTLHPVTKLIFAFNMLIGRLEIMPFLVIFNPDLWTKK